jgi:DNA-binding NarL/FixJ family response regulator
VLTKAGVSGRSADASLVRVVVGHFDPLVVRGVVEIIGDDPVLRIVGSGLPPAGLERALVSLAPEVAVVDEAGERAVGDRLRMLQPATALVVLAQDPTPVYGMVLLEAGVSCFARSRSAVELVSTIRLVSRGDRIFAGVDGEPVERRCSGDAELLTMREREVAVYLSEGEPYSGIAFALGIGVRTVETYAGGVRHKLRARHNRELVGMPVPRAWRRD